MMILMVEACRSLHYDSVKLQVVRCAAVARCLWLYSYPLRCLWNCSFKVWYGIEYSASIDIDVSQFEFCFLKCAQ
jgi:hypothetical protein